MDDDDTARPTRVRERHYWLGVLFAAMVLGGLAYLHARFRLPIDEGGHGPDPGSREWLAAMRSHAEAAPSHAAEMFGLAIVAGAVLRGVGWCLGKIVRI